MRCRSGKWQVDRYPLAGRDGGTYRRDNIVIACPTCNMGHKGGGRTCPKRSDMSRIAREETLTMTGSLLDMGLTGSASTVSNRPNQYHSQSLMT